MPLRARTRGSGNRVGPWGPSLVLCLAISCVEGRDAMRAEPSDVGASETDSSGELESFERVAPGVFEARHGLRVRVDERGMWATGRSNTLHVSLERWGRRGEMNDVLPTSPEWGRCAPNHGMRALCAERVEQWQSGLVAWHARDAGRVQQGWDLQRAPAGQGPVWLELGLNGARIVSASGSKARLVTDSEVWTYSGLRVWDSLGTRLPSRFVARDGGLRVEIEDDGASYPVFVDPYLDTVTQRIVAVEQGDLVQEFGADVQGAGDLNGDGHPDIVVGSPWSDSGDGAVYVYYGALDGSGIDTSTEQRITDGDTATKGLFGLSVANVGDLDDDGFDELLVGGKSQDGPGTEEGTAWLYYGSATGVDTSSVVVIEAPTPVDGAFFGESVAAAGKVNNDEDEDFLIAVPSDPRGGTDRGSVYLFLGDSFRGAPFEDRTKVFPDDSEDGDLFGVAIAGGFDLDGDGRFDIAVGASGDDEGAGSVYVYPGHDSGLSAPTRLTAIDEGISTAVADAAFGLAVSGAGDVDGDGYEDLIVGAPGEGSGRGAFYLFTGGETGLDASEGIRFEASDGQSGQGFGSSVSGGGDLNGDGFDDVVVGAPIDPSSPDSEGSVYVYYGSPNGLVEASEVVLQSDQASAGDRFGWAVDVTADLDSDGMADVLIGSRDETAGEGAVYVYTAPCGSDEDGDNSCTGLDCNDDNDKTFPGAAEHDSASACMTDVDGDGYGDITPGEGIEAGTDCVDMGTEDDIEAEDINPGIASDTPGNDSDEDCDGELTCYVDADRDTYGSSSTVEVSFTTRTGTCDDWQNKVANDALDCLDSGTRDGIRAININPDEPYDIVGNDADEDCDGFLSCFVDEDGDGYGRVETGTTDFEVGNETCDAPELFVSDNSLDCWDDNPLTTDAELAFPGSASRDHTSLCMLDRDGDDFGESDPPTGDEIVPGGIVAGTDCNDGRSTDFPRQTWYPDCDDDGLASEIPVIACSLLEAVALTPCADGELPDGGWTTVRGAEQRLESVAASGWINVAVSDCQDDLKEVFPEHVDPDRDDCWPPSEDDTGLDDDSDWVRPDGCVVDASNFDLDDGVDCIDYDDDNDGVEDFYDRNPINSFTCRDADGDGCDDCTRVHRDKGDPMNDGLDSDKDGQCDLTDDIRQGACGGCSNTTEARGFAPWVALGMGALALVCRRKRSVVRS